MAGNRKKDEFDWKEGATLSDGNSEPLGDIRAYGLPKVNKALAKDPVVRKQEREKFLAEQQNRQYAPSKGGVKAKDDEALIVDEQAATSDHSGKFEDSEVKRLTGQGNRIRGLDRFGKK